MTFSAQISKVTVYSQLMHRHEGNNANQVCVVPTSSFSHLSEMRPLREPAGVAFPWR